MKNDIEKIIKKINMMSFDDAQDMLFKIHLSSLRCDDKEKLIEACEERICRLIDNSTQVVSCDDGLDDFE